MALPNSVSLQSSGQITFNDIQSFIPALSHPGQIASLNDLYDEFTMTGTPYYISDFYSRTMSITIISSKSYSSGPYTDNPISVTISGDVTNTNFTASVTSGDLWLSVTADNINDRILVSLNANFNTSSRSGEIIISRSANTGCADYITINQAGATTTTTLAPTTTTSGGGRIPIGTV